MVVVHPDAVEAEWGKLPLPPGEGRDESIQIAAFLVVALSPAFPLERA